jgi:hypothetical protein
VLYVLKGGVLAPIFTGNALREKGRGGQAAFLMPLESIALVALLSLAALDLGGRSIRLERQRRAGLPGAVRLAQPALAGLARGRRAAAAAHAPGLRLAAAGLRAQGRRRSDRGDARKVAGCMPSPSAAWA